MWQGFFLFTLGSRIRRGYGAFLIWKACPFLIFISASSNLLEGTFQTHCFWVTNSITLVVKLNHFAWQTHRFCHPTVVLFEMYVELLLSAQMRGGE